MIGSRIVSFEIAPSGRYGSSPPAGFDELEKILAWEHYVIIESIDVKGKFMHWTLGFDDPDITDNDDRPIKTWLHCTYGMTGQWVIDQDVKHPVVTFGLSDGRRVTFNDPRHFGTLKYVFDPIVHANKLASVGPDLFHLDVSGFVARMRCHPKKTLAEALMSQSIVSGCGNYIKAEALHAARLSPHRLVETLSDAELNVLFHELSTIMYDSYLAGGATIRTYKNPDGTSGEYTFTLKVYGKETDPDGNPVTREETRDGRITWWCPSVQR